MHVCMVMISELGRTAGEKKKDSERGRVRGREREREREREHSNCAKIM